MVIETKDISYTNPGMNPNLRGKQAKTMLAAEATGQELVEKIDARESHRYRSLGRESVLKSSPIKSHPS